MNYLSSAQTAASDYYKSHHVGNYYCGLIAAEAGVSGLTSLAIAVKDATAIYFGSKQKSMWDDGYSEAYDGFRSAGRDFLNAALFGYCAFNKIGGAIAPVAAVIVDKLNSDSYEKFPVSRFKTCILMKPAAKILTGASEQLSHNFYLNQKIAFLAVGSLAVLTSCYYLGIDLSNLKLVPIKLTIG